MTSARLVHITLGYVLACTGAVLACMVPFLPLVPFMLTGPAGPFFPLILIGGVAALALPPSLIAIFHAERHAIRARKAHLLVGATIGVVATLAAIVMQAGYWPQSSALTSAFLFAAPLGAVPGAIGGLVYRATAGREAGGDGRPERHAASRG